MMPAWMFPIQLLPGWWLVTKSVTPSSASSSGTQKEQIGYIASDYLKPYRDHDVWKSMSSEDLQKYLGFVGPAEEVEAGGNAEVTEVKYVAIQDYRTEDTCQLCLTKEEIVLVMEKSEDGILVAMHDLDSMITFH